MGTSSAWTPERRAKQAEAIRRNQPWAKSTGPRTAEGKAISSRNADKGVHREEERAMDRRSRARMRFVKHLIARDGIKPFGPLDQVGRRRQRNATAQARYDDMFDKLYAGLGELATQIDDATIMEMGVTGRPELDDFITLLAGRGYPLVDVAALVLAVLGGLRDDDDPVEPQ